MPFNAREQSGDTEDLDVVLSAGEESGSTRREAEVDQPATGGTLAGEDVAGGSVLRPHGDHGPLYGGEDNVGELRVTDPAMAGTVAGNTVAAGAAVGRRPDDAPDEAEEDLGPEGTIVQQLGGEARY